MGEAADVKFSKQDWSHPLFASQKANKIQAFKQDSRSRRFRKTCLLQIHTPGTFLLHTHKD